MNGCEYVMTSQKELFFKISNCAAKICDSLISDA